MTERKRIGACIPIGIYQELKKEAKQEGYTLNAFILQIFRNWLDEQAKAR